MPCIYDVDEIRRLVWVRFYGNLCDRDLIDANWELRSAPRVPSDYRALIDLREAKLADLTAAGIRALARRPPLFLPGARRAIVAPTDLGFGMARMFEMFRGGRSGEICVFRDLDEAEEWLGLD